MEYKATLRMQRPLQDNVMGLHFQNYNLIHCEYSFHKKVNRNGEVLSDVIGGNIRVAVPVFPTDELLAWVFDHGKKFNGEIIINDANEEALEKVLFEEARCVEFRLHYEPSDTNNVILLMTINVQKMKVGTVEYKNSWR